MQQQQQHQFLTAIADLAWDGCDVERAFAVVREPAHVRFLTEQWRLVGVPVEREADVAVIVVAQPSVSLHNEQQIVNATHAGAGDALSPQTAASAAQGPVSNGAGTTLLRLRLEEIYVGLYHGFLTLTHSSLNSDVFARELLDAVQCSDAQVPSPQTTHKQQQQVTLLPTLRARLRVFRDLWERGYHVAFGSKFSAELLIYEAAPVCTHAVALVLVRAFDAPFDAVDIASHCRVAKMVKKRVFFASCAASAQHCDARTDVDAEQGGAVVYIAIDHALLATRQEL